MVTASWLHRCTRRSIVLSRLSRVEETFVQGEDGFELGANQFPFAVSPKAGHFARAESSS
jgi:hypothetical protein